MKADIDVSQGMAGSSTDTRYQQKLSNWGIFQQIVTSFLWNFRQSFSVIPEDSSGTEDSGADSCVSCVVAHSKGFVCGGKRGTAHIYEKSDDRDQYRKVRTVKVRLGVCCCCSRWKLLAQRHSGIRCLCLYILLFIKFGQCPRVSHSYAKDVEVVTFVKTLKDCTPSHLLTSHLCHFICRHRVRHPWLQDASIYVILGWRLLIRKGFYYCLPYCFYYVHSLIQCVDIP